MKHARCFYLAVMLAASIALDATADPTRHKAQTSRRRRQPPPQQVPLNDKTALHPRLRWWRLTANCPAHTLSIYCGIRSRPPGSRIGIFAPTRKLPAPLGAAEHLAILVNSTLYPGIRDSLSQYAADLASEGYTVYVETVAGGAPEDIKDWIQERYAFGCTGVVFIGDIAAAWAEVSGDVFPCDLFYMDLDGHWQDADHDGDYEIHTAGIGDEGPELYVARLYAHTLDYGAEADLINDYLAKAHAYWTGTLTQPWGGLEYVDKDWFDMEVNLDQIYGANVVRHDYGHYTTAADYLDQMDLGQHFVQVCAHSYSGAHHFSTAPTESASYAHVYVYTPRRDAYLLPGSDDGIKAWLNTELVCTHDVYQEWAPTSSSTPSRSTKAGTSFCARSARRAATTGSRPASLIRCWPRCLTWSTNSATLTPTAMSRNSSAAGSSTAFIRTILTTSELSDYELSGGPEYDVNPSRAGDGGRSDRVLHRRSIRRPRSVWR